MTKYLTVAIIGINSFFMSFGQSRDVANKAIFLEDVSWTKAKEFMTPESVVVIPLGAEAKEHGPHLPLSSDYLQAMDVARRIALERKVIIAPPINFGFYPVFIKYAGSTCLSFTTSVELIVEVVRSISENGPKRFYIINIGVSTTPTLELAAKILKQSGILLFYSDYSRSNFGQAMDIFSPMEFGGHADDIETGSVLAIRPDLVNMSLAVNDSSVKGKRGAWSPVALEGGTTNKTGIAGYAAMGTKELGIKVLIAFSKIMIEEIDSISKCKPPQIEDKTNLYKSYEGLYKSQTGDTLEISQNQSVLYYILNHRDKRNFYPLFEDAMDYFMAIPFNILFMKNNLGIVEKAWCQDNGRTFWVIKM